MRTAFSIGLIAAIATSFAHAAGTGHTQYKWRDASGALHYSDSLPPEASRFGYEVVNGQGLVVKRVERAKTAEELVAAKAAAAKADAERVAAEQQAREDERLLSMYGDESDLKHSQQQRLDSVDQEISAAKFSLRNQEQTLADLLDRAAEYERTGKPLPEFQTKQIATLRTQVDEQHQAIARREQERVTTAAQLDAELAHYRELKAKQAAERATP